MEKVVSRLTLHPTDFHPFLLFVMQMKKENQVHPIRGAQTVQKEELLLFFQIPDVILL